MQFTQAYAGSSSAKIPGVDRPFIELAKEAQFDVRAFKPPPTLGSQLVSPVFASVVALLLGRLLTRRR